MAIKATLRVTFAIYILFGSYRRMLWYVTLSHLEGELIIVNPFIAGVKAVAEAGAEIGLDICVETVSVPNSKTGATFGPEDDAEDVSAAFSKFFAEFGAEGDVEDASEAGAETFGISMQLLMTFFHCTGELVRVNPFGANNNTP